MKFAGVLTCACALVTKAALAFVPAVRPHAWIGPAARQTHLRPVKSRQDLFATGAVAGLSTRATDSRRSRPAADITTMGLFGLGVPEIAVCIAVAGIILGPDKLASVAKDVGKMAGELKDVPAEFQAGIAEGEKKASSQKALGGESSQASDANPILDAQPASQKQKEEV